MVKPGDYVMSVFEDIKILDMQKAWALFKEPHQTVWFNSTFDSSEGSGILLYLSMYPEMESDYYKQWGMRYLCK